MGEPPFKVRVQTGLPIERLMVRLQNRLSDEASVSKLLTICSKLGELALSPKTNSIALYTVGPETMYVSFQDQAVVYFLMRGSFVFPYGVIFFESDFSHPEDGYRQRPPLAALVRGLTRQAGGSEPKGKSIFSELPQKKLITAVKRSDTGSVARQSKGVIKTVRATLRTPGAVTALRDPAGLSKAMSAALRTPGAVAALHDAAGLSKAMSAALRTPGAVAALHDAAGLSKAMSAALRTPGAVAALHDAAGLSKAMSAALRTPGAVAALHDAAGLSKAMSAALRTPGAVAALHDAAGLSKAMSAALRTPGVVISVGLPSGDHGKALQAALSLARSTPPGMTSVRLAGLIGPTHTH